MLRKTLMTAVLAVSFPLTALAAAPAPTPPPGEAAAATPTAEKTVKLPTRALKKGAPAKLQPRIRLGQPAPLKHPARMSTDGTEAEKAVPNTVAAPAPAKTSAAPAKTPTAPAGTTAATGSATSGSTGGAKAKPTASSLSTPTAASGSTAK